MWVLGVPCAPQWAGKRSLEKDGRSYKQGGRFKVMAQGKVKWFSNVKGYGFIAQEGGPDVFVHHTAIEAEGYRSLKGGQVVDF